MSIIYYCMQQHELRPLTKSLSFAAAKEGQTGEHTLCTPYICNRSMLGAAAQQQPCSGSVEQLSGWTVLLHSPCDFGAPAGRTSMCTVTTVSGLGSPIAGRRSEQHEQLVRSPAKTG